MSVAQALNRVWSPTAEKSKSRTFVTYLSEQGLLAGRPLNPNGDDPATQTLKPRNKDRIRILKRLSAAPSGLHIKTIVSEVLKGQRVGECERFDGSDADYQFAYTYLNRLSEYVPPDFGEPLVRKREQTGGLFFAPTPALLDLISEGIAQTPTAESDTLYDRDFALDILQHAQSLTENQKEHLESALESYVNRIDDYALLFDVTLYGGDGHGAKIDRMTKPYKTRFNDQGRIAKRYSQFQSALEHHKEHSSNAVLATVTSDPGTTDDPTRPDPRSIAETTGSINKNHNRLNNWLKTDPTTVKDTRREDVPQWRPELDSSNYNYFPDGEPTGGPPEGPVSGRPREKLEYIKVLEFTEAGYPHLHILFFDVPTRDSDGMPWLCDKAELAARWKHYGQGQIVDTYPLVYRDDLDDLEAEFAADVSEGFVDWYRYGDHDHSDEWVADRMDAHERIDFTNPDSDEQPKESTAGAYLGKYLSATFGALMDTSESMETNPDTHEDKTATWKLALYWATGTRFWSLSKRTRHAITPNEHCRESADVAETVRWAGVETISRLAHSEILDRYARRSWNSLDELETAVEEAAERVVSPNVESTLPDPAEFGVVINYIGAYAKWDLPTKELSAPALDDTTDQFQQAQQLPPSPRVDRPPPIAQAYEHSGR